MFNPIEYHRRLTEAGLPDRQATIMMNMMEEVVKIINIKDEVTEDDNNAV